MTQAQGRQLNDLVGQMQAVCSRSEEELKKISSVFTDKTVAYTTVQRRKQISFVSSDFEDFLAEEEVARLDMLDTDNLLTLMVVVPKNLEDEFTKNYSSIGSSIACFGGIPDWTSNRFAVGSTDVKFGQELMKFRNGEEGKGSPVVPGSLKKVREDSDMCLFTITTLKGHYAAGTYDDDGVFVNGEAVDYIAPLKAAFRDKKYIIR